MSDGDVDLTHKDAERAILGICFADPASLASIQFLEPKHFSTKLHEVVFGEMLQDKAQGNASDPLEIGRRLGDAPPFLENSVTSYLLEAFDGAPPYNSITHHARLVFEAFTYRQISLIANRAIIRAERKANPPAKILSDLTDELLKLPVRQRPEAAPRRERLKVAIENVRNPKPIDGVKSGISDLDIITGYLRPKTLIIVAGRTGMGKTTLVDCIGLGVAAQGRGVLKISAEMSAEELDVRELSHLAFRMYGADAPSYSDIDNGVRRPSDLRMLEVAAEAYGDWPLVTIEITRPSVGMLREIIQAQLEKWKREGIKCGLVIVDHVTRMSGPEENRYLQQTEIAMGLKDIARELGVAMLGVAQGSRKSEDRENHRPRLADLKETGALEENADLVMMVYRPAVHASELPKPKLLGKGDLAQEKYQQECDKWQRAQDDKTFEVHVLKNRRGKTRMVRLFASMEHNFVHNPSWRRD